MADAERAPVVPVRLVRGNASPEELSAVIAIVAVLASTDDDEAGRTERPTPARGSYPQPPWGSPSRKVRTTRPHGPGGWRASAFPG